MMPSRLQRLPWALLVLLAAFFVPALGSRFYTFLANDMVIWALFATSLNLLVGYTGLVSFGHAAYFGIGAYATGLLMKQAGVSFLIAFPAAGVVAGLCALVFGFFCVRLTRIYFAMLTLAFAQIVSAMPFLGSYRTSDYYYFTCLVLVALCLWLLQRIVASPFGRMLTTIRENAERAEFIGVNVRLYELAAFVLAGTFAGPAGSSESSIAASSRTSRTGPSRPRC